MEALRRILSKARMIRLAPEGRSYGRMAVRTDLNHRYHGDEMDIVEKCQVRQVRLDTLFAQEIDLLKMDLQGYELEALKGSERLKAIFIRRHSFWLP